MMPTIALALSLAQSPEDAMRQVQRSHIEADVPADADFERLLQGDLDRYFKAKRPKPFKLTYEFLRRGAHAIRSLLSQVLSLGSGLRRGQGGGAGCRTYRRS